VCGQAVDERDLANQPIHHEEPDHEKRPAC
jgi:hypothetical protein